MIQLSEVSLQRGTQLLLDQADLTIHPGWKVGIIGANGVGKSSLFKLLRGQLQIDAGELTLPGNSTIAHMAQEVIAGERQVLDYVLDGDAQLRSIQAQISEAESSHQAEKLGELHGQLDAIEGYSAEARARQLLAGLGFAEGDAERPVSALSGGWRIRLNLAQALMCRSDILLLDEPTNHLDLDATLWLEQWLRNYPGTLLLISHDRDFLDQVVGHIAHMHQQKLTLYRGQYSAFERAKAERLAQQQVQYEKQQAKIAHIESFVRRFRAKASKAKQAQSRIKELERMEQISAAHIDSPFTFSFPAAEKASAQLINLHKGRCGYAGKVILDGVSLVLTPGSRVGLLGPNGAGKSTLIKSLVGELPLLQGERSTGEHLSIGYFNQHQLEALDLEASPLLHILRLSPEASDQQARNYLGSFGFLGDDALKTVKLFSGGEKARLALALIAWQKPNLLLLDEPTNHLDLEVCHALTMALQEFEGAVILVSHDRHLLRNTVDEFWLVANGRVAPFDGDLPDYQKWLASQRREQEQPVVERANRSLSAAERKEQKRQAAANREKMRPLKKQIDQLEKTIDGCQSTLATIEEQLADTELYSEENKDKLKQLLADQAEQQGKLDTAEEAWMEAQEQLEELEASLEEG